MFIAEIGINHKGDKNRALNMLQVLAASSIDAVTFQILEPLFYENNKQWGQVLGNDFYSEAINFLHQHDKKIGFAIKDKNQIAFLNQAGADFWKTLSGSINDDDLLMQLEKTQKPVFISTGLSSEEEIIAVGKKFPKTTFIHTQLSHELKDSNVKAIERLKMLTHQNVAFGLHAKDHHVVYLSLAFEPSDVFFYIKDNASEIFPDGIHAMMLGRVGDFTNLLKELQKAVGDGIKTKTESKLE